MSSSGESQSCSRLSPSSKVPTLEDSIDNPLLVWTGTPFSEISRHRLIDLDKASLLANDFEFVLVNQFVVPSTQFANCLVVLIQEGYMTMAVPVPGIVVTLKAEEYIFAFPSTSLKVGGPDRIDAVA